MTPGVFEYHRPNTVAEAVALLGQFGDDGKVLAGGQAARLSGRRRARISPFS